jgi:hypothetical protein
MTDGASESGNGLPPAGPARRRDLRDSLWGKVALLVLVLLVALLVSKSCAANSDDISPDEAVELAIEQASFEPCPEEACRQVRYLQRGVPPVGYWGVVLSEELDAYGRPNRTESFVVNATTGEVTKQ